jgi:Mg-chelatase subunit ChlD
MAKQGKRAAKRVSRSKNGTSTPSSAGAEPISRRDVFGRLRNGALVLAGTGAVGWYIVSEVRAGIQEADLSKIGNGIPTVVQIHDPQCPTCQALQKEARKALEKFEEGELQYLVANIRQDKGLRLANQHGVQHVTLLLFDGDGERREILAGPNTSANLERAFRRHIEHERRS